MAFNAVSSAFVAVLCLALTLCVKAADEETSSNGTSRALGDSCDCVCGLTRSSRIVGGTRTERGEFPWLAALYRSGSFYCGGSLITDKHILTAAHCVDRVDKNTMTVSLGTYNIQDSSERPVLRRVARIIQHPDYNRRVDFDSDIAILELTDAVPFGSWNIGTACLPSSTFVDYRGMRGNDWSTAVGRGRTSEGGSISPIPLKVDLPLMPMSQCRASGYGPSKITDNMLCAGYEQGQRDACQGDSGGPLHKHLDNTDVSAYELVGVVSWGFGCAQPNLPGVYARISKFMPWIQSNIRGACVCRRE